jgi:hypothetical protein
VYEHEKKFFCYLFRSEIEIKGQQPKKNFFGIFSKMTFLGVILWEKSIACIPEA